MRENKFYKALEQNEVEEFLLGKGEYFNPGDEFSGGEGYHATRSTWRDISNYIRENPEQEDEIFLLIENNLIKILSNCTNAIVLLYVCMYIWSYFITKNRMTSVLTYYKDGWTMSNEFLEALKNCYEIVMKEVSDDILNNDVYQRMEKMSENEAKYLLNINKNLLKERFNFDIEHPDLKNITKNDNTQNNAFKRKR